MTETADNSLTKGAGEATTAQQKSEPIMLRKRIGSTTFTVAVYFSDTNAETLEDKVLRMITREVDNAA
jgi:hypothetical protein